MLTVIDIAHVHLGAGAAPVQPFFFCAWNHSTEPGWGHGLSGLRFAALLGGFRVPAGQTQI
jgi:hypothetical protein